MKERIKKLIFLVRENETLKTRNKILIELLLCVLQKNIGKRHNDCIIYDSQNDKDYTDAIKFLIELGVLEDISGTTVIGKETI